MKVERQSHRYAHRQGGFSLVELVIVIAVGLILAAMAIPAAMNMIHMFRLRNACSQFSSLVQQGRSRAVRDSTYYTVRYVSSTPITQAYVDVNKNSALDAACSGTTDCDPQVSWAPEVKPEAATNAPSTSALQSAWLPTTTGVTVDDGNTSSTSITFSPMGLPCVVNSTTSTCNTASSSTFTAYWMFFENTVTGQWEAVTVTPAGKVQKWAYSGSWSKL
ncbi:MAG TPA: prepilin-type N-terminal cleavage/methylation domain-containing protein [Candidatus Koribacter sp.]|jgi:prepilin-type N-terminal cleavage/methylation domain-containing protein